MIVLYSPYITPRVKYAAALIFERLLGVELSFTEDANSIEGEAVVKVNYSKQDLPGFFQIMPCGLLFENMLSDQDLSFSEWNGLPVFYLTEGDLPFDILSATFFLVTRYEEYLPHQRDQHDRFDPKRSVAFKQDFLRQPLVNQWVEELRSVLAKKYPQLQTRKSTFRFISSIDVDNAYAYLEKGLMRTVGAFTRSILTLNGADIRKRSRAILGLEKDPFDVFDYLIEIKKKRKLKTIFFFLVADYGLNDKNVSISSSKFRSLIKAVNDYCPVGIHPSYASYGSEEILKKEIKRLEQTIHMPIQFSRNHFLRLSFPRSYRQLIEMDILEDHTMGYAAELGFRASICTPYPFYDLDLEQSTKLMIHPFCLMEGTVKYYYGQSPEKAMEHFKPIINAVKDVGGELVALWHNDSLSENEPWIGWRKVYEEMIDFALAE